jgi:hypothetical protein
MVAMAVKKTHIPTRLPGELEICHKRGVIYFHTTDEEIAKKYGSVTILRICQLPKPIPECVIDITHMIGVDYAPLCTFCTCGADRTGPSAEAHDADCPAAVHRKMDTDKIIVFPNSEEAVFATNADKEAANAAMRRAEQEELDAQLELAYSSRSGQRAVVLKSMFAKYGHHRDWKPSYSTMPLLHIIKHLGNSAEMGTFRAVLRQQHAELVKMAKDEHCSRMSRLENGE